MCHWSWRPTDLRSLPPPRLAVGPSRYTVCFQDMPQHALHSQPARRPVSLCSNRALSNYPPWSLLPNYRCSQSTTPSHCNAPVFSKRDRVPCKSIPNRSLPGKKPPRRPATHQHTFSVQREILLWLRSERLAAGSWSQDLYKIRTGCWIICTLSGDLTFLE